MTGIFEVFVNKVHVIDVEMVGVEVDRLIIGKILEDLDNWSIGAKQNDEFNVEIKVRCELPT